VSVSLETDFPERLQVGGHLFMGEERRPLTIASRRPFADGLLLSFDEFPDRDSLISIRNQPLFVEVAGRPELAEGEYYHHQLIGMDVFTEEEERLGVLADILTTGANDVYVVHPMEGQDILLPAIKDVVLEIDPANKRMVVHLLPGLR
jgi:16S rRNA processing protein RimM